MWLDKNWSIFIKIYINYKTITKQVLTYFVSQYWANKSSYPLCVSRFISLIFEKYKRVGITAVWNYTIEIESIFGLEIVKDKIKRNSNQLRYAFVYRKLFELLQNSHDSSQSWAYILFPHQQFFNVKHRFNTNNFRFS